MESLLGVRRPLRDSSKAQSVLDKDAALARDDVPGTVVEREEEERLDAGIGSGGAFGNPMVQERAEGIERTVWEFRSEEMVEAEKAAEAKAAAAVETDAEKKVAESEAAPEVPDQPKHVEEVKVELKERPAKVVRPGKTVYRFIDTSK